MQHTLVASLIARHFLSLSLSYVFPLCLLLAFSPADRPQHVPHGARVQFESVLGKTGWVSPPGSPFVDDVLASLRATGGGDVGGGEDTGNSASCADMKRDTVIASQPGFSAVPSAFARALPASAVVGLGVNDPKVRVLISWRVDGLTRVGGSAVCDGISPHLT